MYTYKSVFISRHPSFLRRLSRSLLLSVTFFHTRSRLWAHLIISDYVLHVYVRMYSKYDILHGETWSNSVRLNRSNVFCNSYNLILNIFCVRRIEVNLKMYVSFYRISLYTKHMNISYIIHALTYRHHIEVFIFLINANNIKS